MTAFYLIVFFPLLAAMGFVVAECLGRFLAGPYADSRWRRLGGWWYLALLAVPVLAAVHEIDTIDTAARVGIAWPKIRTIEPIIVVPLTVVLSAAIGMALYYLELLLSVWLHSVVHRHGTPAITRVVEGGTQMWGRQAAPRLRDYMMLSLLIVVAEELLWRGFLQYVLIDQLSVWWPSAVLVASALFAVNHVYFGARNVLLKAMDAVILGAMLVITSSLVAPVVSHLTFQYFVWRRMARRQLKAAA